MKKAGIIIVKMDRGKLGSAIGLDASLDGTVAIVTESGQVLMATNEEVSPWWRWQLHRKAWVIDRRSIAST